MKVGGRERMDDGSALEELFGRLPVSADWTIGFLTAVRTGPDAIPTSTWVAEIAPAGGEPAEVDLLTRLGGAVAETLRTEPEIICPEPDKTEQEAADFCSGYVRGAELHASWRADEAATRGLLPFRVLANESVETGETKAAHREALGGYVRDLHAYWKGKRQVVHTAPKAGRNDPCPCGSGKKHKKCCLAP